MSKINEYAAWKPTVITYWETMIDDQYYGNVTNTDGTSMKNDLNNYMNSLDSKFNAYASDQTRKGPFIDATFSLANYASAKDVSPSPEVSIASIPELPTGTAKDLFAWWQINLPEPWQMFNIHSTTDQVTLLTTLTLTEAKYTTVYTGLGTYVADDIARFDSLATSVSAAVRERASYLLFAGPNAVITNTGKNLNDVLLIDYGIQAVVDEFSWTIKGIS